jgi:hypothetical protein
MECHQVDYQTNVSNWNRLLTSIERFKISYKSCSIDVQEFRLWWRNQKMLGGWA